MRYAFLFSAILLIGLSCNHQRQAVINDPLKDTDPRWVRVDSLSGQGQYASALFLTDTILAEARTTGDWQLEFRAMMNRARFQQMTGVEDTVIFKGFEARAVSSDFPLNAILHSVIAEQYWSYYRDNRWQIMERTSTQDDPKDMSTWSQPVFMRKVVEEYRASLIDADSLKAIPVGAIASIMARDATAPRSAGDDPGMRARPTLFDLLAHRALEVFRNTETRLAEPTSRFQLNDPKLFSLFEDFTSMRLGHADSTSWELQALKLYRDLERTHLNDAKPDAMVDNALARLAFVRERSTLSDKDSLYLSALITLASRLPQDTCLGDVMVAQARWHQEMGGKYQRLTEGGTIAPPWKWERKTAVAQLDEVIKRFPNSLAAGNAASLKAQMLERNLSLQVEEALLPDAPFKLAVTYTNVPKMWLRILKDERGQDDARGVDGEYAEKLAKSKPLREWSIVLPDDGDLNEHLTEIVADGLGFGHYVVLVSDSVRFLPKADLLSYALFEVTRLAVADRSQGGTAELLVVDRQSGAPVTGAQVELRSRSWESGTQRTSVIGNYTTGADGFARAKLTGTNQQFSWRITNGTDELRTGEWGYYDDRYNKQEEPLRTFLFTDRAIYRPGQPVMFKGIVTRKRGKSTEVEANYKTTVELFDVNGEKVDSLKVTTDAYGSFNGTFKAPQGALTGNMQLREAHGEQSIQVEEYKRPTFEVVFDPIAGQPKLGQEVALTGLAKSYAGVPLDGAKVQWTAKRNARMPWWCGWYYRGWLPWGQSTQVAQGEAVCDAQGKFTVKFMAEADDQFPRGADPIFDFEVEASVTDISGETQSDNTSLSLGYKSIGIELGLGESLDRSTADSIDVHVANLNGQRVAVPMDIRVVKLQAPVSPLRDRLWERPDRFTLPREEHATKFPNDVYNNENDPLTWTRGKDVLHELGFVAGNERLSFSDARSWEVGSYLIEAVAKDASGEEVKVSKHFVVFDPAIQNTGFTNEAFHVELLEPRVESGSKARVLLSSALPHGHALMEVERAGKIAVSRWFSLKNTQQLVELPVTEDDRGGFTVHLTCVERGLMHNESVFIDVPWTNKELKVEWMSFRDKLLPGSEEEWRLKITGSKGEKVAAQLLGAMYDASLDHFVPHGWVMGIWQNNYAQLGWQRQEPFGIAGGQTIWREGNALVETQPTYPMLNNFGYELRNSYRFRGFKSEAMMRDGAVMVVAGSANAVQDASGTFALTASGNETDEAKPEAHSSPPASAADQPPTTNDQPIRSDFRETAFFFPDLLTDRDGSIVLRFKTPDALTRWKVMGLAHTKDLQLAQFTRETVTQKPLMIVPNLPRFLRSGDKITLTAKINVVEQGRAEGLATLDLFDPYTDKSISKLFGLQVPSHSFVAAIGESAVVEWSITVPEGVDVCGTRITAQSKGGPRSTITASDGEERALPVLTDKVLVTESLPLWISKAGTKTFTLEKLRSNTSTTLRNQSLKLEYTPNPAWFAVQALPYLMEFPHECAEQTFSRFYANSIATHIVEERPAIKKVFEEWKSAGPEAFASKLEKNQDLKNVLLAETPWVVNARNERESKQRIGLLFDLQRMSDEDATALKKLRDMQFANGAWPWWSGMQPSRYITEHIVAGFGHLEALKAADLRPDGQTQQMLQRAVAWLDADVDSEYRELIKRTKQEDLSKYVPSGYEIHFLYARSYFPRWTIDGGTGTAVNFYKERLKATWLQQGLQEQVMAALALDRLGDKATAQLIMKSLKERATVSEELGMQWRNFTSGWSWESFPTETHALMIEAFHEVAKDETAVNDLRRYLLKLKQTTDWKTTKATAEACYALLLTGDSWLDESQVPVISVGGVEVKADKKEAGTGSIEKMWTTAEVKPSMGTVSISSKADKPSWGALHWQYFERMDKVTLHESPFSIKKQVMLTQQSEQGPKLIALDGAWKLKAGDKLTIRIELRTDRYVDYVHMKDLRASGLEPTETLSGYKYQGGLGYYQSIRDASTNFFFDRIAPGTYVFEYTLRVTHAGDFSNGITTAMCMYAPEFSSHSEGVRLNVQGE